MTIEVSVVCEKCNYPLEVEQDEMTLKVEPCETCINKAYNDGQNEKGE